MPAPSEIIITGVDDTLSARTRWMIGIVSAIVFACVFLPTTILRADEPYFPEGVFDEGDKERDRFWAREYTKCLQAMDEPSLWKLSKDEHTIIVYRLLWLPSFHPAISVRITRSGKSVNLHVVRLGGKSGVDPGKISDRRSVKLTDDQWTWLQVYLARSKFWKARTKGKEEGKGIVLDGDHLLCEGVNEENQFYHVVDRHNDAEREYEKLCWYILKLSELDVEKIWLEYHGEGSIDESTPR